MAEEKKIRRIFVGGLFQGITTQDLKDRFQRFGEIQDVDIRARKDNLGNILKTFAYLNINVTEKDIKKCMATFNKTKWRGQEMQIQMAKESFLDRLSREREEAKNKESNLPVVKSSTPAVTLDVKGAVPGAAVEGKEDWIVGKYGRVLPVVNIRTKNKKKVLKVDPSKYVHRVKKLDVGKKAATGDEEISAPVNGLTWHIDVAESETLKKVKGEFPSAKKSATKRKNVAISPVSQEITSESFTRKVYHSSSGSDSSDSDDGPAKKRVALNRGPQMNGDHESKLSTSTPIQKSAGVTHKTLSKVDKSVGSTREYQSSDSSSESDTAKPVTKKQPSKKQKVQKTLSQAEAPKSVPQKPTARKQNVEMPSSDGKTPKSISKKQPAIKQNVELSSSEDDSPKSVNIRKLVKKQKVETSTKKMAPRGDSATATSSQAKDISKTEAGSGKKSRKEKTPSKKSSAQGNTSLVKVIKFDEDIGLEADDEADVRNKKPTPKRQQTVTRQPAFAQVGSVDEFGVGMLVDKTTVTEDNDRKWRRDQSGGFSSDEDILDAAKAGRTSKLERIAKFAQMRQTFTSEPSQVTGTPNPVAANRVYHSDTDSDCEPNAAQQAKQLSVKSKPTTSAPSSKRKQAANKKPVEAPKQLKKSPSSSSSSADSDDSSENNDESQKEQVEKSQESTETSTSSLSSECEESSHAYNKSRHSQEKPKTVMPQELNKPVHEHSSSSSSPEESEDDQPEANPVVKKSTTAVLSSHTQKAATSSRSSPDESEDSEDTAKDVQPTAKKSPTVTQKANVTSSSSSEESEESEETMPGAKPRVKKSSAVPTSHTQKADASSSSSSEESEDSKEDIPQGIKPVAKKSPKVTEKANVTSSSSSEESDDSVEDTTKEVKTVAKKPPKVTQKANVTSSSSSEESEESEETIPGAKPRVKKSIAVPTSHTQKADASSSSSSEDSDDSKEDTPQGIKPLAKKSPKVTQKANVTSSSSSGESDESEGAVPEIKQVIKESTTVPPSHTQKSDASSSSSSEDSEDSEEGTSQEVKPVAKNSTRVFPSQTQKADVSSSSEASESDRDEPMIIMKDQKNTKLTSIPKKAVKDSSSSVSSSSESEDSEKVKAQVKPIETKSKSVKPPAKSVMTKSAMAILSQIKKNSTQSLGKQAKLEPDGSKSTLTTAVPKKPGRKGLSSKDANLQRLESLKQRSQEKMAQKNLLKQALASVESASKTNRIVFDSDSEDEKMKMAEQESAESSSSESSSRDDSDSEPKSAKKQQKGDKRPTLFNDSEDSNDEDDAEEQFKLRPQFEGEAGRKLMQLQSRYGNDSRFKVTEHFLESEGEKSEGDPEEEMDTTDDKPTTSERERTLDILNEVVGNQSRLKTKSTKAVLFKDMTTQQYDPTKGEHKQYEVEPKKKEVKKKKKEVGVEREAEPVPEVSGDRFFEVQTSLKDAFNQPKEEPFSLLAMLGRSVEDALPKSTMRQDGQEEVLKHTKSPWQEQFGVDDSSDEERGDAEDAKDKSKPQHSDIDPKPKVKHGFFFVENDPRIAEGIDFFRRQEDLAVIKEKWSQERPELVEAYRNKSKRFKFMKKAGNTPTFQARSKQQKGRRGGKRPR